MKKLHFAYSNAQTLVFNRWSRKSYGIFSSIHRVVNIGVLTCTITLLASSEKAYAQTDTIKINNHLNIDEVVVSASRTQKMFNDVPRVMTIIPAAEIQRSAAQSINELLKSLPGIDIRQRGGQGVQSDISLRGGSFEQTLILINGIPFNDPQTGHHSLNIPINLDIIERIEILYGPNARVYGPNAFTGAVNIITNNSQSNAINALVASGQYGLFQASASAQLQTGKINHYLSFGQKQSDGYKANTDFKATNIFYRNSIQTKPGTFSLQAGYLNKGFGAQDFYTLAYPEQYEQVRQISAAAGYTKSYQNLHIKGNAYWKMNNDRFELFREDTYAYQNGFFINKNKDTAIYTPGIYESWNYYKSHNYHQTQSAGLTFNTELKSKFGLSALGFDYRYDEIYSNVLGTLIDSIKINSEKRGYFTKMASRNYLNIYAEHSFEFKKIDLTIGALYHNNSSYGSKINGGFELSYNLHQNLQVFGSINQALRMPTFTDLYYDGPRNAGNPNLKPEEAITYEFGLKDQKINLLWQAAAYYRQTTNAIDWVKYPSETEYTTTNFSELNTFGTDLLIKLRPENLRFINYISGAYTFVNANMTKKDSAISAYALDYLRHKLTLSTNLKLVNNFGLQIDVSLNSRNGNFEDVNTNLIDYKPYLLIDTRLYYNYKILQLFLDANNLLNTNYMDIGGIEQAGLWIKAGIKLNLTFN
jgi:iron complex outermembrane receptor protein